MLPLERKQEIVKIITKQKSIKVTDLALQFNVTEETIRRDLEKLEKENVLKRTYGGAVFVESSGEEQPFTERVHENIEEKRRLAEYAAQFIRDGETIMLDSSTTALEVGKALKDDRKITIITDSLNATLELSGYPNLKIITAGGLLNTKTMSFEGPTTVDNINNYYADKLFISCKGLNLEQGLLEPSELTAEIKRKMIRCAKFVVLVADRSKFEKSAMVRIDDFSHIDALITTQPLDEAWMTQMDRFNIEVVVVE